MSASKPIEHSGTVEKIDSGGLHVSFIAESACASCHAKGYCTSTDQEEKRVLVKNFREHFVVGEQVKVILQRSQGMKAILLGYVYPFLLVLLVLLVLSTLGIKELSAGLISLAILVPYYIVMYLFRKNINNNFSFSVRKTN